MTKEIEIKEKIAASDEAWDERDLGADEKFVSVASDELTQQVLESAGTHLISIRLQKSLIEDFKLIASLNGLGYQTLMKQILQRFVDCEKKQIFRELVSEKLGEKASPRVTENDQCKSTAKRRKVA
jgi:predicted DNA binding CopG/RHH family protein